jgi:hypothetical protein
MSRSELCQGNILKPHSTSTGLALLGGEEEINTTIKLDTVFSDPPIHWAQNSQNQHLEDKQERDIKKNSDRNLYPWRQVHADKLSTILGKT